MFAFVCGPEGLSEVSRLLGPRSPSAAGSLEVVLRLRDLHGRVRRQARPVSRERLLQQEPLGERLNVLLVLGKLPFEVAWHAVQRELLVKLRGVFRARLEPVVNIFHFVHRIQLALEVPILAPLQHPNRSHNMRPPLWIGRQRVCYSLQCRVAHPPRLVLQYSRRLPKLRASSHATGHQRLESDVIPPGMIDAATNLVRIHRRILRQRLGDVGC
mmetsp:Transcript_50543/g.130517  ORF Transcript_50543/g.130517 Transcript_50543/m.130517 type:complete len:214 (-) Transcript_50543:1062-1703(-)